MTFGRELSGCVLSAGLLAWAQHHAAASPVALVALAPWIVVTQRGGGLAAIGWGALTGTVYGCLVAPWMPEALRALGSSAPTGVTGLVVTAAWAKAPMFAVLGLAVRLVRDAPAILAAAALGASVFGLEWVVSTASWSVPWALLGHSQLPLTGVSQLAVAGGVPLVSALVAAVSVVVARLFGTDRVAPTRACVALVSAWISLAALGLPLAKALRPEPYGPTHQLLVLQPAIPRGERWGDHFQALNLRRVRTFLERSAQSDLTGVAAILLPENLLTTPADAAPELLEELQAWVDRLGVPVVTGLAMAARDENPDRYRGAVVWIQPGSGITARIDKVRAVPVLESGRKLLGESLLAPLFGEAAGWKKVEEAEDAGPLRGRLTVTPVLCYEALFPRLVAKRRAPDSVAIVNLADDGWVAGDTATHQLTAFATFRAIEERLTLIRVAHGGLSVAVDPFGERTLTLPLDTYAATRVEVQATPPPTLLEKFAIAALPAGTGLVVWWIVGILFTRRQTP